MRIVAKFGGTSLGNSERIERAADSIEKAVDDGHEVVVVASAMGDTTDRLLEKMDFEPPESERDEVVSMGERTSVRILKAALESKGVDSTVIEPDKDGWPVIAEEKGSIDEEVTKNRSEELVEKMGESLYLVTGFLAEDKDGNITTLGRGGSDTTAMLLGNYMDADRVTIVTDVEGVLTGDPSTVEAAHNVGEISVDAIRDLSFRGADVIAPSALKYKREDMDVEIVHHQQKNLLESGTSIEGEFNSLVDKKEEPLACLTVAGRKMRQTDGILSQLSGVLAEKGIVVDAVSSGMDSLSFFIENQEVKEAQEYLHEEVKDIDEVSSVTVDQEIAAVRLVTKDLPDRPGLIKNFVDPLYDANINIHELVTSATCITVLVEWENGQEALEIMQDRI